MPVSYTHLDVYKRQFERSEPGTSAHGALCGRFPESVKQIDRLLSRSMAAPAAEPDAAPASQQLTLGFAIG